MARYIDADKIPTFGEFQAKFTEEKIHKFKLRRSFASALVLVGREIHKIPTEDVAPVVHGKWLGYADGYADGELVYDIWLCSNCDYNADGAEEEPTWKFCPNCGARMDG